MNLPSDAHLAYTVFHEAWYASVDKGRKPSVMVMASVEGGGVKWEFEVARYHLGGEACLRVAMFDDSFAAYDAIPEFFDELATGRVKTLDDVRAMLDGLGASDNPDDPQPSDAVAYVTYPPTPGWPRGRYLPAHVCQFHLRDTVNDAVNRRYPIAITPMEPAP